MAEALRNVGRLVARVSPAGCPDGCCGVVFVQTFVPGHGVVQAQAQWEAGTREIAEELGRELRRLGFTGRLGLVFDDVDETALPVSAPRAAEYRSARLESNQ